VSDLNRVLIIGLDAATPHLIERWAAEGRLPNIKKFLDDGAWGQLNSVANRNSAPAWSSMVTGLNPGKHGIYWFTEDDPTTYDYKFINGSFRRGKAFWNVLSEEGQTVSVMNVPITFPAQEVNGVMIAGMDSPSADDPRFTYPSELRHEVKEVAGGEYYVYPGLGRYVIAGQTDQGLDRIHRSIDMKKAVAKHLMTTRPWDTFMVVFTESDVVQHFFWRHMDRPAEGDLDMEKTAIRDTYEHLDRVIGDLVEEAGPDTTVIAVSDHGARFDDGLARALPSWLEQLGLLNYRKEEGKITARSLIFKAGTKVFRQLDKRLSAEAKHKLSRRLPMLRQRVWVMMSFGKIDWSRTRAYTDGHRPEIWINLEGRQPQGVVSTEEYDVVRQEIIDALTSAVCVTTNQPLVKRVWRREEAYSGPFVDRSPDLVVEWMDAGACLDLRTADGGSMTLEKHHLPDDPFDELMNGGHDQFGIVAMKGPGIKPGHIEGAEIADIAPTVLFLRDAPIPEDVDGKLLSDAFDDNLLSSREVKRGGTSVSGEGPETGYSAEEEAEVRDRLQALGYVE
jgi:predicted AlkP superfamily phosphohydrolase/phosphomutase